MAGAGAGAVAAEHLSDLFHAATSEPGLALALGGGAAAGMLGKSQAQKYLNSPGYAQRVIGNTLNPQAAGVLNPAAVLYPAFGNQGQK